MRFCIRPIPPDIFISSSVVDEFGLYGKSAYPPFGPRWGAYTSYIKVPETSYFDT